MMNFSIRQSVLWGVVVLSGTSLFAQAPPPDVDQIQKDAQLLFEDLKSHQQQIEAQTVDDLTIQLQDEILTIWDRLLDQSGKQKKKKQSNSPQNQQPQNQDQNQEQQPQDQSPEQSGQPMGQQPMPQKGQQEEGEEPQASQGGPDSATGEESQQPADQASEETRERQQGRLLQVQREERERLMKEVWGKLPERIRQKLLNASDEQYLPAYEERIREYFRKLSEQESR